MNLRGYGLFHRPALIFPPISTQGWPIDCAQGENEGMGFLYILQRGLEHVPLDLHKIEHCKDSNGLQNRPRQLRTTGIVGEFEFKAFWEISPEIDIREVEDAVHLKLRGRRVAPDREFFRGPLDALIAEIWSVLQYMSIEASFTQLETPLDTLHRGGRSGTCRRYFRAQFLSRGRHRFLLSFQLPQYRSALLRR